jgi:1-acyl-sn-glycerol-3-phosphate acyltransferase
MIPKPLRNPPKWWSPMLSPLAVRWLRPMRRAAQRKLEAVHEIEVRGGERLREALGKDQALLIAPNHPGSGDPYAMYHLSDVAGRPFYFMAAWELFAECRRLTRGILRLHGVFSVDRDGTDLNAFKRAVEVLKAGRYPLVIFPEGEVYHVNDRITPFREGPAAIALSTCRKGDRPVAFVPVALKYHYLEDPTPGLERVMEQLERQILWRPRTDEPLDRRIYCFAEAALGLKELEYTAATSTAPLPERVRELREFVLSRAEQRQGLAAEGKSVPERIKAVRQRVRTRLEELPPGDPARIDCDRDRDDVFFCVQLFSYPGDYVEESPSIERIAETIDKFAEDVLGMRRASVCAARKIVVSVGEPLPVDAGDRKTAGPKLTRELEQRVQSLLDELATSQHR